MAVANRVAFSQANPTMEFDDYSLYSDLSDEELIQLAIELSLAERAHPPNPIQNRQPPPPSVVQRPASPNPRPRQRSPPPAITYNFPPANPPPANHNPAHPPSGNPLMVHRKKDSSPLRLLIENGDPQPLMARITSNPDSALEQDSEGWIALHEAAYFGRLQCLEVLLEAARFTQNTARTLTTGLAHPAMVNKCSSKGQTPLLLATGNERVSCVEYLLIHGADPNLSDKDGETPLFRACEMSNVQIVALLLKFGASVNKCCSQGGTPFHEAARNGEVKICKMLLEAGANVGASNRYGIKPFFSAAQSGHVDVVNFLIRKGVDHNSQANDGATPLYEACKNGHVTTVEILLSHNADANRPAKSGLLPIHIAVQNSHTCIVSMLIPVTSWKGVKRSGLSPLHIAAECNQDDILEMLIEAGYDVNAELSDDRLKMYEDRRSTALYFSVSNRNYEAAEMLLEAGANPNVDLFNPLLIAVRRGCIDMVTLLLRYGANVNAYIPTRPTTFPSAVLLGMQNLPMLKLLMDYGCDATACFNCAYGSQPHPPITPSHHHSEELRYRGVEQPPSPLQFCDAISNPPMCNWAGPIISLLLDYVGHVKLCSRLLEHLHSYRDWAEIKAKAVPPHPLMQLCRLKIRQLVGVQRLKHVNSLPLPGSLIKFLNHDVQYSLIYEI